MYKVVKKKSAQVEFDRARLGISLGQDYHKGEKFKILCEWVAKRFNRTEVMVADTLNRWNTLAEGRTDGSRIAEQWRQVGNLWLEENEEALAELPSLTITRWDDYLEHPDFERSLRVMQDAYNNNLQFRKAIDAEIERVRVGRGKDERVLPYYRAYLLEDCAVNALLNDSENIYPGSIIPIRDLLDLPDAPRFTRVSFTRKLEAA